MPPVRIRDNPFLRLQRTWRDAQTNGYILPGTLSFEGLIDALRKSGCVIERIVEVKDSLRYYDTQDGRLFAGGLRLFFSELKHVWTLDEASGSPQSAEGGEEPPEMGSWGDLVRGKTRGGRLFNHMIARCDDRIIFIREGGTVTQLTVRYAFASAPGGKRKASLPAIIMAGSTAVHPSGPAVEEILKRVSRNPSILTDILSLGLTLLGLPFPGAPFSAEYTIDRGDTLRAGLEKIALLQVYRIWANTEGTLLDLDPEFLHDMRVATRRLRSALRFLREFFDEYFCGHLRDELAWIAALLGNVRDMDVFIAVLKEALMRNDVPEAPASDILAGFASSHRDHRKALNAGIRSNRFALLMSKLCNFSEHAYFKSSYADEDLMKTAAVVIQKALKKCGNALKKTDASLTDESMHGLRIAMKRLRYSCEFFAPLFDGRIRQVIRRIVKFQDCLGAHQDAIVAMRKLVSIYFDLPMRVRTAGTGSSIVALVEHFKKDAAARKEEFLGLREDFDTVSAAINEMIDRNADIPDTEKEI